MAGVKEIEEAVLRLSSEELAEFRAWFAEFDADACTRWRPRRLRIYERAAVPSGEAPRQSEVLDGERQKVGGQQPA